MKLRLTNEFKSICEKIVDIDWSAQEWSEHESDDSFVADHYEGGYDAERRAFCFTYVGSGFTEYWFKITLTEVSDILAGTIKTVEARKCD